MENPVSAGKTGIYMDENKSPFSICIKVQKIVCKQAPGVYRVNLIPNWEVRIRFFFVTNEIREIGQPWIYMSPLVDLKLITEPCLLSAFRDQGGTSEKFMTV